MTITSYPFEGTGAGIPTESKWADLAGLFSPSGICMSYSAGAGKAGGISGLNFTIDPALLNILGTRVESDSAITVTAVAGSTGGARIDRYVWRRDLGANNTTVVRIPGTPSATPSAPSITRNSSQWDIKICDVLIAASATSITSITDQREVAAGVDNDTGSKVLLARSALSSAATNLTVSNLPVNAFKKLLVEGYIFYSGAAVVGSVLLQLDSISLSTFVTVTDSSGTTSSSTTKAGFQLCRDAPSGCDFRTFIFLRDNEPLISSDMSSPGNAIIKSCASVGTDWLGGQIKLYREDGGNLAGSSTGINTNMSIYGLR